MLEGYLRYRDERWPQALEMRDPDLAEQVRRFYAAGGTILIVPAAMSGEAFNWHSHCALVAIAGHAKRHGLRGVPAEARRFVLSGVLSLTQARAGAAWDVLRTLPVERAHVTAVSRALHIYQLQAMPVLDLLVERGHARITGDGPRSTRYQAVPPRPDWRAFLPSSERRAA